MNVRVLGIGLAAGIVSAALFAVVATGSPMGFLLFFLAPLPVAVAGLGWNHRAGMVASLVAAIGLGAWFRPTTGFAYAVGTGLPTWWFAYLALLARPLPEGGSEWYPLGRLLLWIAAAAGVLTVAAILSLGLDYAAYTASLERALDVIERINPRLFEGLSEAARQQARGEIARVVAALAPPIWAALSVPLTVLIVWGAARVVAISGRLPRPWPDLAGTALPRGVLGLAAGSLALSFLDDYAGLAARTLCGAMLAALAMQGLAVAHALSAGAKARPLLLSAMYLSLLVLSVWPMMLLALVGAADVLFALRARRRGPPSPPSPVDPTNQRSNTPWT